MKTFSRRTFSHLIAAGVPLLMATGVSLPARAQLKNKRIQGVRFGAMSFSFFADMPKSPESGRVDNLIRAMTNLGLYDLEIMPDDLTPPSLGSMLEQGPRPPAQRRWWAETPLSHFEGVRRKFNDAGINVDCFMGNDWETDKELNRDFLIAKALGARYLGRPAGIERITRMARAAEKQNFPIYVHNETENEDYLLAAMGVSPIVHINFDTGNYTAMGGTNHLEFMRTYHDRITHLHLKDRKRDGTCTPFGEGDTPVKEVLRLLRDTQYDIGAFVENEVGLREYFMKGQPLPTPTIESVRQFVGYMKQVLA